MRRFSSYGPIDTDLYYYAPREMLLANAYTQLLGENPEKGGHYITVWAPRQTGKTWVMQQILFRLLDDERFDVVKLNLQHLQDVIDVERIVGDIGKKLLYALHKSSKNIPTLQAFEEIFTRGTLEKPLILILDEFDSLSEEGIASIVRIFRNIYLSRRDDPRPSGEKEYLLHGVALIGVRSVLGIENVSGSPFNVQRSLHIPNLSFEEVEGMFKWYERESGQKVEQDVIEQVYYETNGQPGLTCWFGELLTEGFEDYCPSKDSPITQEVFEEVYGAATHILPNNTILHIISKAKHPPYKDLVFKLFKTDEKLEFRYNDREINFLYMNGVIDREKAGKGRYYIKFSCPFVQKSLFQYFAKALFKEMGKLHEPFENLDDTITEQDVNIANLMKRYERHLRTNRDWLLKDAPRKADLRIYEAVYHFNLYMYLSQFLQGFGGSVYPEFPTGNGKIDLIITYAGKTYGLEVKSYTTHKEYQDALTQAARYGKQLHLSEISLIVFVESIDDANRNTYEAQYVDTETRVVVSPVFVEIEA